MKKTSRKYCRSLYIAAIYGKSARKYRKLYPIQPHYNVHTSSSRLGFMVSFNIIA